MVIAIVVVLAAVVLVAMGRGGQLSAERSDYAPLELGPVSATDVVLLRPPTALWGYDQHATDEAMEQIAESIRERDVRIVALEQLVTDLSQDHAQAQPLSGPYVGARRRRLSFEETGPPQAGPLQASSLQAGPLQAGPQEPRPQRDQPLTGPRERLTDPPERSHD
jgi:hypothetical protein